MLVSDVISVLKSIAPCEFAEEWDNVGLLCGNSNEIVSKVLVTLDCSIDSVKKAIREKCNLIVTHHPIIFKPIKSINLTSPLSLAIKNNISIYAMHTNMDNCDFSMNFYIANKLHGENIKSAETGVYFEINKTNIRKLADNLKAILGEEKYKIKGDLQDSIERIFLATGAGINEASFNFCRDNVDIFVSSEIKHNYYIDSENLRILEFSHFNSELPFEGIICDILKNSGINSIPNKSIKPYIEY